MKRMETEKIDGDKYLGDDITIVSAEIITAEYGPCLKVESGVIPFKDGDTLPEDKKLTASVMLGLKEEDDGTLYVPIDGKADKWLKKHKVNVEKDIPDDIKVGDRIKKIEGMKGKVTVNSKGFLDIA